MQEASRDTTARAVSFHRDHDERLAQFTLETRDARVQATVSIRERFERGIRLARSKLDELEGGDAARHERIALHHGLNQRTIAARQDDAARSRDPSSRSNEDLLPI